MSLIYKPIAIGLLLALVLVGGSTGAGWWLAARDRDAARADLVVERDKSAQLAAAVARQNQAIDALASAKSEADVRGKAAQALAAANGRRFDQALAGVAAARATTCPEAMPTVNAVLEAIK